MAKSRRNRTKQARHQNQGKLTRAQCVIRSQWAEVLRAVEKRTEQPDEPRVKQQ